MGKAAKKRITITIESHFGEAAPLMASTLKKHLEEFMGCDTEVTIGTKIEDIVFEVQRCSMECCGGGCCCSCPVR